MKYLRNKSMIGIDLFAGAGGMSLGAAMAGVDVQLAVEMDPHSADTYAHNHPNTKLIRRDIRSIKTIRVKKSGNPTVLFGGPPCQGFSTSNQRTRSASNPNNWLFEEFIRVAKLWKPDWIVFENVKGIAETEKGMFLSSILSGFENIKYRTSFGVLCSADYGVPQLRHRLFIIGSRHGIKVNMPKPTQIKHVNVRQSISDLPLIRNGSDKNVLPYRYKARSSYAKSMRNGCSQCSNNLVTKNADHIIERYKHIPQGGNWEDIPAGLMKNYQDRSRCHTGIYRRLDENEPSVVLGNYRKNMLIHPTEDRGLSVREAARLQSFPDWYEFKGSIGFQQQQVSNAVPPLLAKSVFSAIITCG